VSSTPSPPPGTTLPPTTAASAGVASISGAGAPPQAGAQAPVGGANAAAPAPEACPLCGAPLGPDQEWCLNCGAAARTRLATSSSWKVPVIAIAVVVTLSLGVLAASLVSLAGNSNPAPVTDVTTVTNAETALTPPTTTTGVASAPSETARTATISPATPQTGTTTGPSRAIPLEERLHKLEVRERLSPSPAKKQRLLEQEARLRAEK
jgi:hypothetical protein